MVDGAPDVPVEYRWWSVGGDEMCVSYM
jgi:hypothetical protein